MHPKAQALLEIQLDFIATQFRASDVVATEVLGFFDWLKQQKVADVWTHHQLNALLQQQILGTPATQHLITQIQHHIQIALEHPHNDSTTIEDILPVATIDQIAFYIASKSQHRKQLVKRVVQHSFFLELITNIVQQSVKDFMDHSMVAKKVPGVGSLMKMGKSVFERATDSSFDDTLKLYLHKNADKLILLSEKLINQNINDEKLYQLQAKLWHSIKTTPLSAVKHYVIIDDLPHTVALGEQVWNHLRQTPYLQAQVALGVEAWIERHAQQTFAQVLHDLNIDENLIATELYSLVMPIIAQLVEQGYLMERARFYLTQFYSTDQVTEILEK